jgi:hypothetical protein
VTTASAAHGLAVQAGSAADVGIAGFLLSGGISWLARSRGLAVNDVVRLEVVGADGTARIVDHDSLPVPIESPPEVDIRRPELVGSSLRYQRESNRRQQAKVDRVTLPSADAPV